jgi:hypothetical protein
MKQMFKSSLCEKTSSHLVGEDTKIIGKRLFDLYSITFLVELEFEKVAVKLLYMVFNVTLRLVILLGRMGMLLASMMFITKKMSI